MPGLPAQHYQLAAGADVTECTFCGARPTGFDPTRESGPSVQFVAVDTVSSSEPPVPPALTETIDDSSPIRRAYTYRDAHGRGHATVLAENPLVCSACVRYMGELLGLGDVLPVTAQLEEREAELSATRKRLEEALQRAEEAEETIRSSSVFERLLSAQKKPATRKAAA